METNEGRLKAAGVGDSFLLKARLALALAVIKTKPPGVSGRAHAEALAQKLKSSDESWKEKAQRLQLELLTLRQESLITKVTSNNTAEAADLDETMINASEDLFDPGSDVDLRGGSETPDLLPPASTLLSTRPHASSVLDRFVRLMSSLRRVQAGGLELLWFGPDGSSSGSVFEDSVVQILDLVVSSCRDPPPPPPPPPPPLSGSLLLQGCVAAGRALQLYCCQRTPSEAFRRRVEASLGELAGLLLHSDPLSGAAEDLMNFLIALGSSSLSESFLICHIVRLISGLADQLWQVVQDQDSSGLVRFPLDQYQNSCYLFWVVEELLQRAKVPYRLEAGPDEAAFLRRLEQRGHELSDEFPLFYICLFKLGGLLVSSEP